METEPTVENRKSSIRLPKRPNPWGRMGVLVWYAKPSNFSTWPEWSGYCRAEIPGPNCSKYLTRTFIMQLMFTTSHIIGINLYFLNLCGTIQHCYNCYTCTIILNILSIQYLVTPQSTTLPHNNYEYNMVYRRASFLCEVHRWHISFDSLHAVIFVELFINSIFLRYYKICYILPVRKCWLTRQLHVTILNWTSCQVTFCNTISLQHERKTNFGKYLARESSLRKFIT